MAPTKMIDNSRTAVKAKIFVQCSEAINKFRVLNRVSGDQQRHQVTGKHCGRPMSFSSGPQIFSDLPWNKHCTALSNVARPRFPAVQPTEEVSMGYRSSGVGNNHKRQSSSFAR